MHVNFLVLQTPGLEQETHSFAALIKGALAGQMQDVLSESKT